ncbi:methyltransferase domain-containing protein [Pendulispora brunnea]|uniref:Methyltransferase domain-containing protein n=1 Tax=Pendulispora brunnea TaxID=2905690 RepID=A0ABZ2KJV2_9BACT
MGSVLQILKLTTNSSNALSQVNVGGEGMSESESDKIKQNIGASYDFFSSFGSSFWNWGMDQHAVHQKLAREIPNYDQYGSDGCSEQLYFYTFNKIPRVAGQVRKVLEVGSGTGAGLNFISRLEAGSEFVGLDISQKAVARANGTFARPGALSFVHGDAERLPFPDGEFDAVINVESSHNYPNLGKFIAEVARVLRPGGYFSHVDMYSTQRREAMNQCKTQTKDRLVWLEEEDVTDHVKASIRKRLSPNSVFLKRLKANTPRSVRPLVKSGIGAWFVKDRSSIDILSKLLSRRDDRSTNLQAEIRTYAHTLAKKAP